MKIVNRLINVLVPGIIAFFVLSLIHKYLFKHEDWFMEALLFQVGWSVAHFIALGLQDFNISIPKTILIDLGATALVIILMIIICKILNAVDYGEDIYTVGFAFGTSILLNSFRSSKENKADSNDQDDDYEEDENEELNN